MEVKCSVAWKVTPGSDKSQNSSFWVTGISCLSLGEILARTEIPELSFCSLFQFASRYRDDLSFFYVNEPRVHRN